MMHFDLPKEKPSIIKVIGVGGGGSNAVNHMYRQGIRGVEFLVCNTDLQALEMSPVQHKIQLGANLTEGRGAGSMPEVGKNSAIENLDDLRKVLSNHTKMVFITAGMGGGTGTGAAPIIAGLAREMGILTVGIATVPFSFEGKKRRQQAEAGIEELKRTVDTLLVICNDKLREIHGNLKIADAFGHADNILATAAKSIAEIISVTLHINVDFADVQTVMKDSGVAIMGSATAVGENRALKAVELALDSPLLNDNNIEGARYILLNITSGNEEITMDEMAEITDYVQNQAGQTAEVIMGVGTDESLGEQISVTIIATGFKTKEQIKSEKPVQRIVHKLEEYSKKDTIAETFAPVKNELEPVLLSETVENMVMEAEMPLFIDEEKIYEPEIDSPVIFNLEEGKSVDELIMEEEIKIEEIKLVEKKIVVEEETIEEEVAEEVNMEDDELKIVNLDDNSSEDLEEEKAENVFTFEISQDIPVAEENPLPVMETHEVEEIDMTQAPVAAIPPSQETVVSEETQKPVEEPQKPVEDPHEELFRRSRERIMKLKEMSYKMNTPQGLNDLEKEPAFRRRNIKLDDVPQSNTQNVSRFSLVEDQDKKVEIKPNSFLHDKVD